HCPVCSHLSRIRMSRHMVESKTSNRFFNANIGEYDDLTPDQRQWQAAAIEFARSELADDLVYSDQRSQFDRERWNRCAHFGVFGMPVPTRYGGLDLGLPDLLAVMEGLGYAGRDQGLLFSINAHLWTNTIPILAYGTEEQKQKYLPYLSNGNLIGANAASEPDAGSDVFAMRTRAERHGDHYILNGTKTFVTNASVADIFVAYATLDPALGPMGITAFVIEKNTPGLLIGRK